MSKRTQKVSGAIKHELGNIILAKLKDENLKFVCITRVDVTADLKRAHIFFTSINKAPEKVMNSLEKAKGMLKLELVKKVKLRYTPDLVFIEDKGVDYSIKIGKILKDVSNDKENITDNDGDEEE